LVNMLVHTVTGVLLFFFLRETLTICALKGRSLSQEGGNGVDTGKIQAAAALSTLIWIVHPIQTQAVTYVVQRMTALAAMFYLAALLSYIAGRKARSTFKKVGFFTACALSGLLALGSKEIAVTLPAMLFVYEWYFFQDLDVRWIRKKAVYLFLIAVFVLAAGALYTGKGPSDLLDSFQAGYKTRPFTMAERLMTQPRVVVFYLSLLLIPHPSRLNVFHDVSISRSLFEPVTTLPAMFFIAALFVLAAMRARKNRFASFAVLWFFGNLVLESSVVPLELVFEHRLYLPSMMLLAVPVTALVNWMRPRWRPVVLLVAVAAVFATWTYQRNAVWADKIRLLSDCVEKSPNQARTHYGLAGALSEKGRLAEAAEHLETALALEPNHREAQNALGAVLAKMGRTDAAIAAFEKVLEIDPNYAGAYYNLGRVYRSMGRFDSAVRSFEKAVELQPYAAESLLQLAWLLSTAPDPALREGERALSLSWRLVRIVGQDQPLALDVLAAALAETGRFPQAVKAASRAKRLALQFQMVQLAEQIEKREALYRQGRPFREGERS
ncbi:MAG: tetratricopeptide repeat protein, partial [Desulfobacterales bacterium]